MPTDSRRSFLARFGVAAAAVGLTGHAGRQAQTPASGFQPARHAADDWLDKIPGQHRLYLDIISPGQVSDGLLYASNFLLNQDEAYGVKPAQLAVVVGMRHFASPLGFTDAWWAKYGAAVGEMIKFKDPKTGEGYTANPVIGAPAQGQTARPNSVSALVSLGVQFAVCEHASRNLAAGMARRMNLKQDEVFGDMKAHLIASARFVPAGIIALNRAHEHGFTVSAVG